MSTLPKFAANGWRRLDNGHVQHVSGLEFAPDPDERFKLIDESLSVFIRNLHHEGATQQQTERLLHKLTQQVAEQFMGLH